jgi:hypothetical protein
MNILKSLLVASVMLPTMTSCLGSGEESQTYKFTYSNNYTYVTDVDTGETFFGPAGDYEIKYDYTNAKADVSVDKLLIDSKGTTISFSLTDCKLSSTSDGGTCIESSSFTSTVSGETHQLTSFSFTQYYRTLSYVGVSSEANVMSYIIDGRYVVRVVQKSTILIGETTVKDLEEGTESTQTRPYYYYELDRTAGTAKVIVGQLKYGSFTAADLTLEKVPFTISNTGFTIKSDGAITPSMAVGNGEENVVTDLSIVASYAPSMIATFKIADKYTVNSSLDAIGKTTTTAQ